MGLDLKSSGGARGHLVPPLAWPIGWMLVIAGLSSSLFGADRTEPWLLTLLGPILPWIGPAGFGALHVIVRKLGHLVEYGILAVLWLRALAPGRTARRAAVWAVGLSALYAVLDEARQGLTPNRSPAAWDVAIDALGALIGVLAWGARGAWARRGLRLIRWAVWLGVLASLAAAALDWALGLGAADLLLAALGLALLAFCLGWLEHAWRSPS